MKTIGDILTLSANYLKEKNASQSKVEIEHLVARKLNTDRLSLYMQYDRPLTEEELVDIRLAVKRLASGEPLQYIEGSVSFYNLELEVTPDVLIPRPETELLVEKILEKNKDVNTIFDICTGSGCIGLSLKKSLPTSTVVLSDISEKAVAVAKKNGEKNSLDVEYLVGDLFAPFSGRKADLIVSNPPYISEHDYAALDSHVRDFEPKTALVGGKSGLEFYERFAKNVKNYLNPGGTIWFEVGLGQAEQVKCLFADSIVNVYFDYQKIARFVEIRVK